jgi:hypothetical protein
VHSLLAGHDLLDSGKDGAPVLKDGEGHVLAGAVGDEVVALLSEEKVGLACGGEVRHTVAGVEESRALVGGELGVRTESEGLVVSESTGEVSALKNTLPIYGE